MRGFWDIVDRVALHRVGRVQSQVMIRGRGPGPAHLRRTVIEGYFIVDKEVQKAQVQEGQTRQEGPQEEERKL